MKYPDDLPCVQYADFTISRQFDINRTQMESGWTKHRRMSEFNIETITLGWTMDVPTFKRWFAWMETNGYSWFDIKVKSAETPDIGEITIQLDSAINYSLLGWNVVKVICSAERLVGSAVPVATYTNTSEVPWK
mgnify:CR=1 FL=1